MARTACLVIAALVVTAGCAGSDNGRLSKSEYEAKLRAAFGAAAAQLRPGQRSATSPELVARIAGAYGGIASRLKRVRPPADAEALNTRLVAGATREAATLHGLAAELERASRAARGRLLAEFDASRIAGQEQFDRAVAVLRAKGYRFSSSAGT